MKSEDLRYCGDCGKPSTWIRKTQFAGEHPFCDGCALKQKDFHEKDASDFLWKKIPAEEVAPGKSSPYQITKSSSAERYYVGRESGENHACSARADVCEFIAKMLDSLPSGITSEDVVKAFGGGKPYGNLMLPDGDKEQKFIDVMTRELAILGVYNGKSAR